VLAAVSSDAVLETVGGVLVAAIGIAIEANRRWANRVESSVTDHAKTARNDTAAVAATVVEVKVAQKETNSRLHDTRERLARLEGSTEFIIARQSDNLSLARKVATTVEHVQDQLKTVNGLEVGELADRAEGRRISEIPELERTHSEQRYVQNLEEGGRGE
jgi:phage shock protein A